jgi:Flp pilus assembly protein TadD
MLFLSSGCAARSIASAPTVDWSSPKEARAVRLEVADSLLGAGQVQSSLQVLAELRAEGHRSPELDVLQARAMREAGLHHDAEALLQGVVQRHPRRAGAHDALGTLYLDMQRIPDATDAYRTAVRLDEDSARYLNNLGFALLASQDYPGAVEALRKAIRIDPTLVRARDNLGYALVAAGDTRYALEIFRSTGSEADAQYNTGLGLELSGQTTDATRFYQAAVKSYPNHPQATEALARLQAATPAGPDSSSQPGEEVP